MAKRAPAGELPYRPLLDPSVLSAALTPVSAAPEPQKKIVEFTRAPEQKKQDEPKIQTEVSVVRNQEPVTTEKKVQNAQPVLTEKLDQERRLLLTRSESQALDRLVTSMAARLNTQVKASHVLRAMVTLLLNSEGEVDRRAGESATITRPPNGDLKGLQKFESDIANIIGSGIRDAGPVRLSKN